MASKFFAALITITALMAGQAYAAQGGDPKWNQLEEDQQQVLAPLAKEWDTLRPWQRERMLDIARDYPKMNPQQQERVQQRLDN